MVQFRGCKALEVTNIKKTMRISCNLHFNRQPCLLVVQKRMSCIYLVYAESCQAEADFLLFLEMAGDGGACILASMPFTF
jgi:hypothetical protein